MAPSMREPRATKNKINQKRCLVITAILVECTEFRCAKLMVIVVFRFSVYNSTDKLDYARFCPLHF